MHLVFTDIADVKAKPTTCIINYKMILATLPLPEVTYLIANTQRFNIRRVDWVGLEAVLIVTDWRFLYGGIVDEATIYFQGILCM